MDGTSLGAAQAGPGGDHLLTGSTEAIVGIAVGLSALTGIAEDPAQTPRAVCHVHMALLHREFHYLVCDLGCYTCATYACERWYTVHAQCVPLSVRYDAFTCAGTSLLMKVL